MRLRIHEKSLRRRSNWSSIGAVESLRSRLKPHRSGGTTMTAPQSKYLMIPLTQGQFARVDKDLWNWLMNWNWQAHFDPHTNGFYAVRRASVGKGKQLTIPMHRQIKGLLPGDGKLCDHEDGDTLNNRRNNLRIATHAQNGHNRKTPRTNASGFKGVWKRKDSGKYEAYICVRKKRIYLGCHETAEAAGKAYAEASKQLHGKFARLK